MVLIIDGQEVTSSINVSNLHDTFQLLKANSLSLLSRPVTRVRPIIYLDSDKSSSCYPVFVVNWAPCILGIGQITLEGFGLNIWCLHCNSPSEDSAFNIRVSVGFGSGLLNFFYCTYMIIMAGSRGGAVCVRGPAGDGGGERGGRGGGAAARQRGRHHLPRGRAPRRRGGGDGARTHRQRRARTVPSTGARGQGQKRVGSRHDRQTCQR